MNGMRGLRRLERSAGAIWRLSRFLEGVGSAWPQLLPEDDRPLTDEVLLELLQGVCEISRLTEFLAADECRFSTECLDLLRAICAASPDQASDLFARYDTGLLDGLDIHPLRYHEEMLYNALYDGEHWCLLYLLLASELFGWSWDDEDSWEDADLLPVHALAGAMQPLLPIAAAIDAVLAADRPASLPPLQVGLAVNFASPEGGDPFLGHLYCYDEAFAIAWGDLGVLTQQWRRWRALAPLQADERSPPRPAWLFDQLWRMTCSFGGTHDRDNDPGL